MAAKDRNSPVLQGGVREDKEEWNRGGTGRRKKKQTIQDINVVIINYNYHVNLQPSPVAVAIDALRHLEDVGRAMCHTDLWKAAIVTPVTYIHEDKLNPASELDGQRGEEGRGLGKMGEQKHLDWMGRVKAPLFHQLLRLMQGFDSMSHMRGHPAEDVFSFNMMAIVFF